MNKMVQFLKKGVMLLILFTYPMLSHAQSGVINTDANSFFREYSRNITNLGFIIFGGVLVVASFIYAGIYFMTKDPQKASQLFRDYLEKIVGTIAIIGASLACAGYLLPALIR